ncbi:hypothetical protein GCM10022211_16180 [Sphingomonas humi]|uniref:Uncharacterized protein n=1 Tax=Sphingomonas humi TaxID=335630 RepID=A0ABP7S0C6_9SPHN
MGRDAFERKRIDASGGEDQDRRSGTDKWSKGLRTGARQVREATAEPDGSEGEPQGEPEWRSGEGARETGQPIETDATPERASEDRGTLKLFLRDGASA